MYEYTFKFEIFGQKKKFTTLAKDEATAKKLLGEKIMENLKIDDVNGKRVSKGDPLDDLFNMMQDAFNRTYNKKA